MIEEIKTIVNHLRELLENEEGQSMVEYGLIIGIIAVAGIILLTLLGQSIRDLYPVLEPYLMTMV